MNAPQIVVAEDDINSTLLLREAFKFTAPNLYVVYTSDGKMVLDFLQGKPPFERHSPRPPALLVLDLKMPCVDGFEVLEFLLRHPHLRPDCIAVFSSSDQPSDRSRAAALGADCYLVKPVSFQSLLEIASLFAVYAFNGFWPPQRPPEFHLLRENQQKESRE